MNIIKEIGRALFEEERGWLGAAVFFSLLVAVAYCGILYKLELSPWSSYFWKFKEYMWPYFGLCIPPSVCFVGWAFEFAKNNFPEIYEKYINI